MIQVIDKNGKIKTASPGGGAGVWGAITGTLSDQTDLQGELDLKAPKNSPTFTGTVAGITKAMVGLPNVDNTSDSTKNAATVTLTNKTISTATNTIVGLSNSNLNGAAAISDANIASAATWNAKQDALTPGTDYLAPNGNGSALTGLTKTQVGLPNVDNTSDVNKPVSTAQATAIGLKENTITPTTSADYYRGDKTFQPLDKTAVGLSNVDNTSDTNKPVSTLQQAALNTKLTSVVKNVVDSSGLTGTLTETIMTSLSIPAGTFAVGDIMKVSSFDEKILAGGALQIKYYVNTINSLSGANAIFLYSSAASLKSIGTSREYYLKASNVIYGHSQTANNVIVTEAGTANTPLSLTFNYTGAFFIIKTFVLGNTGDNAIGKSFRVEKL